MKCNVNEINRLIYGAERGEVDALVVLAQAASYKYWIEGGGVRVLGLLDGHDRANWNPALDDGDALRLAVSTGNTNLAALFTELVLEEQTNGLTGVALIRRAILWAVLQRHLSTNKVAVAA